MREGVFFLIALLILWFGAGISISGVSKLARSLKISSFFTSFIILGTLTSLSEVSVAYFSVVQKTPSISLGNLLGASVVLTLFIIPLLAVFNKGIKIDDRTGAINFNAAYLVISLPALLVLDKNISYFDAGIMLCSLAFLGITTSNKSNLLNRIERALLHPKVNVLEEGIKILTGVVLIILSSKYIVDMAIKYSDLLSISPFLIGLILLSLGTNLPELSVLVRSTVLKKKNIALGDYIGSAVLNSLIICALVVFNRAPIQLDTGLKYNLLLLPLGSIAFIYLTRDGRLERREGIFLSFFYMAFVISEFLF